MAALDLSAAANVLKTFYLGPIREQLNNATILLSRLDRDDSTQDVSGTSFTVPLHTGRNNAAAIGGPDGGALPTSGRQSYTQAVIPNKYVYGRITVSGPTIAATRNNAGAFVRAIESEIQGCVRDTKRAMNRQLHSDGSDALAYYVDGTHVDDGNGNAFVQLNTGTTSFVDVFKSDATVRRTQANAVYSTLSTSTIALGAAGASSYAVTFAGGALTAPVAGDVIVNGGTFGYQMMGIAGIVSNVDPVLPIGAVGAKTGLHGLAAGTNPFWNSQVFANAGVKRPLTLKLMQQPLTAIAVNSDYSDTDVKFLLGNMFVRDKYVDLLVAEKRFINTMKLDGGFDAVEFNGKPFVTDVQCKRNRIYYMVPETIKIYRSSDFDWMDKDGAVLARVAGFDQYEAILFHYGDLGCTSRNGNGLLDDIDES